MSLTNASPEDAAHAAKLASHTLATLSTSARDDALTAIHDALAANKNAILAANAEDLALAKKASENGQLSASIVSRLDLGRKGKWEDMLQGILDVRALEDPMGKVDLRTRLDEGLELERISCPIGVLLIIFEARPEVIANIASLAIKSGNAAILKGGKESTQSFISISQTICTALATTSIPASAIQLVTTRDAIASLLAQDSFIDLVIPRGGNELVRYCKANTRIPVMGHADGLCTIYLEASADAQMAARVLVDAKTGYPAACNAVETLLVEYEAVMPEDGSSPDVFLEVAKALLDAGVSLRCDDASCGTLQTHLPLRHFNPAATPSITPSTPADYTTEFLAPTLAIATVPNHTAAITHINTHSSHHTDCILTSSAGHAEEFLTAVDSAGVYWNASTRFADGRRYGFGTEVGISTGKMHARGPVGLDGLMSYKYKMRGKGQTVGEFDEGKKRYLHEDVSSSTMDMSGWKERREMKVTAASRKGV